MSKRVHKLVFTPEYNFFLIGISSHENDYRISWALNKYLGLKLMKVKDHNIIDDNYPDHQSFSQYLYEDDESLLTFRIIANRCLDGFLIGEMKNIDFFLVILGEVNKKFKDEFIGKIDQLSIVNTAFQIDPKKLKSRQKLLF